MRHPQLVIHDPAGPVARLLAELAGEARWLVREPRSCDAALSLAHDCRPTVVVVRVDPAGDDPAAFALVADVHRTRPDVPVVAVSDVKLPEADRAAWAAALFDLGARYVLFPPLTKPVLEDVASGLMAAAVRRTGGGDAPPPPPAAGDEVIDLADEEPHG